MDQYNFDVPEGMDLMVFNEAGGRMHRICWMRRGLV